MTKIERRIRVERTRQWRLKNPQKHRDLVRKWNKENPEKKRAMDRRWQKANPEKVRSYNRKANRKYYLKHRKEEKARTIKWRRDHPSWWKQYYKKNKKKIAAASRKSAYGITSQEYDTKRKKQKGLCKICKRKMKRPDVDHNHLTGQVRDLLCRKCNVILGVADESIWILQRAIQYLRRHNELASQPRIQTDSEQPNSIDARS